MVELIITEKPNAAKKIAEALADGKAIKENVNKIPYYKVTHKNQDIIIGCAVGHLFGLEERKKERWTYPVFDIEWKATGDIRKDAQFSKKYAAVLKKLCKDADTYTIATDYDIEGEVIGLNIIRFICKQKDAARMKFSTLTRDELRHSFETKAKSLNWGLANAGETRHYLDYFYGINLSRALTLAVKNATNRYKILSSGRVQGPALKIIVDKEKEIKAFVPEMFWQLELLGKVKSGEISAWHIKDKFSSKKEAEKILEKTKDRDGKVSDIEKSQYNQPSPSPFDLTTLQTEAYRCIRLKPKDTLAIAQELYLSGLISYPRTSSQQLSPALGYEKILRALSKQDEYKVLCNQLLKGKQLVPNNGRKTDPAHPAIYPTGEIPKALFGAKKRVYDLIVRRTLATFAPPAVRETMTVSVDINSEIFVAKGITTVERGWHEYYGPYASFKEEELPGMEKGEAVQNKSITLHEKETAPPKRYTAASIIKELEKRNLGTKATRASIVEALYNRGYVNGDSITATNLGLKTSETLEKYCPQILDENLTRKFEEEMDEIQEEKKNKDGVLSEAKKVLTDVLKNIKANEKDIGKELSLANQETIDELSLIGKCQKCSGNLTIKSGKYGRFIACTSYPECKETYKLPKMGLVKGLKVACPECSYPQIEIKRKGKKPQVICINPKCPKKELDSKKQAEFENLDRKCPQCSSKLLMRESVYGKFIGCSNYPKCKYIEKIN